MNTLREKLNHEIQQVIESLAKENTGKLISSIRAYGMNTADGFAAEIQWKVLECAVYSNQHGEGFYIHSHRESVSTNSENSEWQQKLLDWMQGDGIDAVQIDCMESNGRPDREFVDGFVCQNGEAIHFTENLKY